MLQNSPPARILLRHPADEQREPAVGPILAAGEHGGKHRRQVVGVPRERGAKFGQQRRLGHGTEALARWPSAEARGEAGGELGGQARNDGVPQPRQASVVRRRQIVERKRRSALVLQMEPGVQSTGEPLRVFAPIGKPIGLPLPVEAVGDVAQRLQLGAAQGADDDVVFLDRSRPVEPTTAQPAEEIGAEVRGNVADKSGEGGAERRVGAEAVRRADTNGGSAEQRKPIAQHGVPGHHAAAARLVFHRKEVGCGGGACNRGDALSRRRHGVQGKPALQQ